MSRVVVRDLVKTWGSVRAVDGVSLEAPEGRLLALLGPSGCGKSTTLRLIAGLEDVTRGRIEIGDRDVTRLPAPQRRLSMVFQSYALFPHLTVAENIVFGLKVRRVAAPERQRRLQRVAELLGLDALLDRKPAQLSGGQRQRIALGRAIIAEAPVCLMDEPLSNLDAQLRHQMRVEIRSLQQRLGMTMIYVTHDQTEAMTMADHIVLMRQGRIEQQGTPADLYQQPVTRFVAGFLGAPPMNLLPAELLDPRAPTGTREVGIRPERIRLAAAGDGLPAKVVQLEYLGAETMLVCSAGPASITVRLPGGVGPGGTGLGRAGPDRAGPGGVVLAGSARAPGAPGGRPLAPGDAVTLRWDPSDEQHFDARDGRRL